MAPSSTNRGRRVVLLPLLYQGHINPMLRLAAALYSRGLAITIVHPETRAPDRRKLPADYRLVTIPDNISPELAASEDIALRGAVPGLPGRRPHGRGGRPRRLRGCRRGLVRAALRGEGAGPGPSLEVAKRQGLSNIRSNKKPAQEAASAKNEQTSSRLLPSANRPPAGSASRPRRCPLMPSKVPSSAVAFRVRGSAISDRPGCHLLDRLRSIDDKSLMAACINLEEALKSGEHTDIDGPELCCELIFVQDSLQKSMGPLDILNYLKKRSLIYPNAVIAYRILLTIPVTVASAERSFSKLKLLKSYLRSTMTQERLTGLATMALENDVLKNIKYENMIEDFISRNTRRMLTFRRT